MPDEMDQDSPEPSPATVAPSSGSNNPESESAPGDASRAGQTIKARKRTRTGCLTCRKRRIKCGEERPTCVNCVKSRRQCEGYGPRLTFKDPMNAFQMSWQNRGPPILLGAQAMTSGHSMPSVPAVSGHPGAVGSYVRPAAAVAAADGSSKSLPALAPRPMQAPLMPNMPLAGRSAEGVSHQYPQLPANSPPGPGPIPYGHNASGMPQMHPHNIYADQIHQSPDVATGPTVPTVQFSNPSAEMYDAAGIPDWARGGPPVGARVVGDASSDQTSSLETQLMTGESIFYSHAKPSLGPDNEMIAVVPISSNGYRPPGGPEWSIQYGNADGFHNADDDDDPWDVQSDEEDGWTDPAHHTSTVPQKGLKMMSALSANNQHSLRSYEAFSDTPGMLAHYMPKFSSSLLMDPTSARIFCHFIVATGPSLSTFERRLINPLTMFHGKPVPKSQQSLWTYTIPMLALSNQGLLHAILAVSGLQIARLQRAPTTGPIKHYHHALRRVAKAVASPTKRTSIAVLAATLLLAQFEAITAEHNKWTSHLAGAAQLLLETDFQGMTQRIRRQREVTANLPGGSWYFPIFDDRYKVPLEELPFLPDPGSQDEFNVSSIVGRKVVYDTVHDLHIMSPTSTHSAAFLSQKDVEDFQTRCDLYWWFCRMDMIQGLIRSHDLLLPWARWTHCPPRTALGIASAPYGTVDHILLLLGRLTNYAHRDRRRKERAMQRKSASAASTPSMGQGATPPPSSSQGRPPPHMSAEHSKMAPPPPPVAPPRNFISDQRPQDFPPASPPEEELDAAAALAQSEADWLDMQQALHLIESSLGPEWAPLTVEEAPVIWTPFGPALQYRTWHIALIWALLHTSKIVIARLHPSLPAAMMVAAAMSAPQTAESAQLVGRITMGIPVPGPDEPMPPTLAAAIAETMLPIFFAAVQYSDAAQRTMVVERLQVMSRRIGLDSASLMAAGLEMAWVRMAAAGRGPAYDRTVQVRLEHNIVATDAERVARKHSGGSLRTVGTPPSSGGDSGTPDREDGACRVVHGSVSPTIGSSHSNSTSVSGGSRALHFSPGMSHHEIGSHSNSPGFSASSGYSVSSGYHGSTGYGASSDTGPGSGMDPDSRKGSGTPFSDTAVSASDSSTAVGSTGRGSVEGSTTDASTVGGYNGRESSVGSTGGASNTTFIFKTGPGPGTGTGTGTGSGPNPGTVPGSGNVAERGLVRIQTDTRQKWAMGVFSLEEDFAHLAMPPTQR